MRTKRPISEKQLKANRANAKRSTGPRTERGKTISRRNALKHGILSRIVEIGSSEGEASRSAVSSITSSFRPEACQQEELLEAIGQTWWKLGRVVKWEHESNASGEVARKMSSELLRRYEIMLVRKWHASIRESVNLERKTGESL